eukprot:scaffold7738_cov107-Isochrysis_galbana.AAC.16
MSRGSPNSVAPVVAKGRPREQDHRRALSQLRPLLQRRASFVHGVVVRLSGWRTYSLRGVTRAAATHAPGHRYGRLRERVEGVNDPGTGSARVCSACRCAGEARAGTERGGAPSGGGRSVAVKASASDWRRVSSAILRADEPDEGVGAHAATGGACGSECPSTIELGAPSREELPSWSPMTSPPIPAHSAASNPALCPSAPSATRPVTVRASESDNELASSAVDSPASTAVSTNGRLAVSSTRSPAALSTRLSVEDGDPNAVHRADAAGAAGGRSPLSDGSGAPLGRSRAPSCSSSNARLGLEPVDFVDQMACASVSASHRTGASTSAGGSDATVGSDTRSSTGCGCRCSATPRGSGGNSIGTAKCLGGGVTAECAGGSCASVAKSADSANPAPARGATGSFVSVIGSSDSAISGSRRPVRDASGSCRGCCATSGSKRRCRDASTAVCGASATATAAAASTAVCGASATATAAAASASASIAAWAEASAAIATCSAAEAAEAACAAA